MEKNEKKIVGDAEKARNEEYLGKIFTMLKKKEGVALTKVKSHFNNSEMRLLGEVILAGYDGKRIISTQLAARLGVTRSAVSQMVNKLEAAASSAASPTKWTGKSLISSFPIPLLPITTRKRACAAISSARSSTESASKRSISS